MPVDVQRWGACRNVVKLVGQLRNRGIANADGMEQRTVVLT